MGGTAIKLLLMISVAVIHIAECQKRTRKDPSEVPPAAFPAHECRVLINEVNIFAPNDEQYIELSVYCAKQPKKQRPINMKNFKLLFISHDAKLLGSCTLEGSTVHSVGKYWFYVVGNSNKDYVNYNIEKCQLSFGINPLPTTVKMFPGASVHPFGVALLYSPHSSYLDDINLDQTDTPGIFESSVITDKMETKIMKFLQDFYILATSSPFGFCEYFKTFYLNYNSDTIHWLRDWQGNVLATDYSINRCGNKLLNDMITQPMMPAFFTYSKQTPGSKNDCANAFQFVIETYQPLRKKPRVDYESQHPRFRCYSQFEDEANNIEFVAYPQSFQNGLEAAQVATSSDRDNVDLNVPESFNTIANEEETPSNPVTNAPADSCVSDFAVDDANDGHAELQDIIDNGSELDILDAVDTPLQPDVENDEDIQEDIAPDGRSLPRTRFVAAPLSEEAAATFMDSQEKHITPDCSVFDESKRKELLDLPGSPIDLTQVLKPEVCSWFQYLRDVGKFRCKFCHFVLNQKIVIDSPGSPLITYIMYKGVGKITGKDKKTINKNFINAHLQNPIHQVAVNFFKLYDEGLRDDELENAFNAVNGPLRNFLQPTEKLMVAAYQAVKMNVPFFSFSKLTDLLKYYNTDIGNVHHTNEGMKKIVMSISNKMHQDLIYHLKSGKKPLSLTLDCSTDIGGYPVLALLFQTYDEDNNITVFFYRLLYAKTGESGANLFELFKNALIEDGIDEHVKKYLFGLSTDGAPNVLKVFRNLLNAYIQNELVATHCAAHKVNLINKRVFEQYEYLRFIDGKVNALFKFFNNKSAKRKQVLKQMAEYTKPGSPQKVKRWELHRIIKIRFVNSKLRALSAIFEHWGDIGSALQEIAEDNSFKWEHRQTAEDLMNVLKDGTFMSTLAFLVDVDTELSAMSLQLQVKGVTLIPKKQMRDTLYNRIAELKLSHGPYLTKLLENAEFDLDDTHGFQDQVTLQDFEETDVRVWGVSLEGPSPVYDNNRLYKNKNLYVESLLEQVENYFPEDILDRLNIFDPSNFPSAENDYKTYGVEEISELNSKLNWDKQWKISDLEIRSGWKTLSLALFKHEKFESLLTKKPEEFWAYFLTDKNIPWTRSLKKVISNVITVPSTSVEPERIFSLYSSAKTKRRFSLLPSTVEAIVRIKYMGKNKLQELDTMEFANEFLKSYSRADDTSRRTTWEKLKPTADPATVDSSDQESDSDCNAD